MARNDTRDLVILGVAGYAAYRLAISGRLGARAQQVALQIKQGASPGPSTSQPRAGCDTSFIPGVRYVAPVDVPSYDDAGNVLSVFKMFEVVIGGKRISLHHSQAEAEAAYNRAVCGG